METPALATLYNRVANAYASLVKTRQAQDYSQEIDRAIHFFEKSLALEKKLNLPTAQSDTLLQLGDIYRDLGLWERVFDPYQQSLEIARSLKDSLREAAALGRLGNLYQQYPLGDRANNLEEAIASYTVASLVLTTQGIKIAVNSIRADGKRERMRYVDQTFEGKIERVLNSNYPEEVKQQIKQKLLDAMKQSLKRI